MPAKFLRPCAQPGCPALSTTTRCPLHQAQHVQAENARKGSASARGYGAGWKRTRYAYWQAHGQRDADGRLVVYCVACAEEGVQREATVLDHIQPIHQAPELRLDWDNLRPLCNSCNVKAGRAARQIER